MKKVLVAALAVLIVGFGTYYLLKSSAAAPREEERGVRVVLYYYDESRDKDASGNVICSEQGLVEVERKLATTTALIDDTIALLVSGELTADERARGITTEFPLEGLSFDASSQTGETLALRFSDPKNASSGGSCRVNILRAQIERTAKQFPGVTEVILMPEDIFQP